MLQRVMTIISFLALSSGLAGQEKQCTGNWQAEGKIYYGFIFPHTDKLEYLVRDHVSAFEAGVVRTMLTDNIYDQLFHYPKVGAGYFHADWRYPEVLGSVHSLYSFLNAPLIRFSDHFQVDYQITAGLAYMTRKWDLYENNLNLAISSHLNLHFSAVIDYRLTFAESMQWTGGLSFTHFSNGAMRIPNLGINYISVFTGFSYLFGDRAPRYPDVPIPEFSGQNEHTLLLNFGSKQYQNTDPDFYLINSLTYDFGRRIREHLKVSAGLDLFYDESSGKFFISDSITDYQFIDLVSAGAHLGFFVKYRKIELVVNAGTYLHTQIDHPSSFYSRVGLRYHVTKRLFLNTSLKAHLAIADFVEWGIGYRLK